MTLRVVQKSTPSYEGNKGATSHVFIDASAVLTNAANTVKTDIWNTPTSGNLLIMFGLPDSGTLSTPSGWTLKLTESFDGKNAYWFYKTSDGTESTITITSSATTRMSGVIVEIEGADTSGDPFDDLDSLTTDEASPVDLPSITTTTSESLLLALLMTDHGVQVPDVEEVYNGPTTPSGWDWSFPMSFMIPGTPPATTGVTGCQLGHYVDTSGAGTKNCSITHSLGVDGYGYFAAIKADSEATDLVPTAEGAVVTVVQESSDGTGTSGSGSAITINGSTTSGTVGCSDTWSTPTSGNVLIGFYVHASADVADVAPPSGFTEIAEIDGLDVCNISYKISDGTESSVEFPAGGTGNNTAILLEVSGLDTSNLVEGSDEGPGATTQTTLAAAAGSVTSTAAGTWALIYGQHTDGRSDKNVYAFYNGERLTGTPSQGCAGSSGASDPTAWVAYKENQDNRSTHKAGVAMNARSNQAIAGVQGGIVVFKTIATAYNPETPPDPVILTQNSTSLSNVVGSHMKRVGRVCGANPVVQFDNHQYADTTELEANDTTIFEIVLPSSAIMGDIEIHNDDLDTGACPTLALDVGVAAARDYVSKTSGARSQHRVDDLIDTDLFVSADTTAQAATTTFTALAPNSTTFGPENRLKPIWELLGYDYNPNTEFRLTITSSTASSALASAGDLAVRVTYYVD